MCFWDTLISKKKPASIYNLLDCVLKKKAKKKYFLIYTTKEFKIPTAKTKKTHKLKPEKTVPLFPVQPSGEAKTTGTPTIKKKDTVIKAKRTSWKRSVIFDVFLGFLIDIFDERE